MAWQRTKTNKTGKGYEEGAFQSSILLAYIYCVSASAFLLCRKCLLGSKRWFKNPGL